MGAPFGGAPEEGFSRAIGRKSRYAGRVLALSALLTRNRLPPTQPGERARSSDGRARDF